MTKRILTYLLRAAGLAWPLVLSQAPACADGHPNDPFWRGDAHRNAAGRRHDHDSARQARAHGEILPIADILRMVRAEVPGDVIEVELEREENRGTTGWTYEIEILTPDGRLLKLAVDAKHGRILDREED
jgi:hypothetical protein